MAGENVPVRLLQQGSVLEVASGGSISISGSVQVNSGGVIAIASGGSFVNGGGQAVTGLVSVASGGTLLVASGGSVQIAAGGAVDNAGLETVASGGSIRMAAGAILNQAGRENVASGGSILVQSGGSIQVAAGGMIHTAGTISIGGVAGMWKFGSATLASGTALVYTGLTQIVSVYATPLQASPGTATTSPSSFQIDPSRFANGTFYALGLQGTFGYAGAGTFVWHAMGW